MKNWSVGRKLFVTAGIQTLVMLSMVAVGVLGVIAIDRELKHVTGTTAPAIQVAGRIATGIADLRTSVRSAIIAAARRDANGVAARKAEKDRLVAGVQQQIRTLEQLTKIDSVRAACADERRAVDDWDVAVGPAFAAAAAFNVETAAEAIDKAKGVGDRAQSIAQRINGVEDEALTTASASGDTVFHAQISLLTMFMVFSICATVATAWVTRGIVKTLTAICHDLEAGAQQVVAASTQVATASQSLSKGATQQAASLEETSASMEEMSSMTRQNADHSRSAAQLMGEVDTRVSESTEALSQMVGSMGEIAESSQKVSKIIKTIDEIAFQTNILALNAAVEAARAGEAGMGFAVVADEVRNLAQRSAQAAKDTAGLIEESIDKAQSGSEKVRQVEAAIGGITVSVTKVRGLVEDVSAASHQQAQGFDQVSQAIAQMEKVTQTTAATAEESAAATEELTAQAETTMSVVHRLEALVGSVRQAPAVVAPAPAATRAQGARPVVVKLPTRAPAGASAAERAIPLEDTGTFGSF
jgi:hypothetical protein